MDLEEYDNPIKQISWEAYIQGYDLGKNVESLNRVDYKTARSNFERWWKRKKN